MADKNKRPIIIIKKKVAHAGHHGGAWKVAYADFVTAMMALFIVLWLTSSGEKVRKMIAGYFNDPSGKTNEMGTDRYGGGESMAFNRDNIHELKAQLEKQIVQRPDLKPLADQIEIAITPEGMRVELVETKDGTFFESGSAALKPAGKELLQILAKELGGVPNRVSTEGYTDAKPYSDTTKYDNWELSTDRANAARRAMQATGLRPGQVSQVRGFADQRLHLPLNPFDPSNRRVSVIIHYVDPGPPPTGFSDPKAEKKPDAGTGEKAGNKPDDAKKAVDAAAGKTAPAAAEGAKLPGAKESGAKESEAKPATGKPTMMQSVMAAPKAMMGKVTGMFGHKAAAAAAKPEEAKKP